MAYSFLAMLSHILTKVLLSKGWNWWFTLTVLGIGLLLLVKRGLMKIVYSCLSSIAVRCLVSVLFVGVQFSLCLVP